MTTLVPTGTTPGKKLIYILRWTFVISKSAQYVSRSENLLKLKYVMPAIQKEKYEKIALLA